MWISVAKWTSKSSSWQKEDGSAERTSPDENTADPVQMDPLSLSSHMLWAIGSLSNSLQLQKEPVHATGLSGWKRSLATGSTFSLMDLSTTRAGSLAFFPVEHGDDFLFDWFAWDSDDQPVPPAPHVDPDIPDIPGLPQVPPAAVAAPPLRRSV